MKRLIYALFILLLAAGCDNKENIVFPYENQVFETNAGRILMEVVPPLGTASDDRIYIVGDFNGGQAAAVGDQKWALTQSPTVPQKWGIYLDPADFVEGKTLADGYYFYSGREGAERSLTNEEVRHTQNAGVGQVINYVRIERWESYFTGEDVWPIVPADKIQLRFTVPASTPQGFPLAVIGEVNGWNSTDLDNWTAVQIDATHYYLNISPADMADPGLGGKFFLNVIVSGQEWWYHQNNEDGSPNEGPGLTIENARAGNAYEITIENWRNSADLPQGMPAVPADKFMLVVNVPDNTPDDGLIGLFGEWNGWDAMLGNPAPWTFTRFLGNQYYLIVDPSLIAEGKTLADMFHITLYFEDSTPGNWWRHQMNLDGGEAEGPGINNANNPASPTFNFQTGQSYTIDVPAWRYSADLEETDPEDLSVAPWAGLTTDPAKILLQIEVPGMTPDAAEVGVNGLNGWEPNDSNRMLASKLTPGRYYIYLDPSMAGPMRDGFKTYVYLPGVAWYNHENNRDGSAESNSGNSSIPGAEAGKAYTVTVQNWRNLADIPGHIVYPPVPADRIVIHLFVPDNTPVNSNIRIYGDLNNWGEDDQTLWGSTMITPTRYVLELDPTKFKQGSGVTAETTANGFDFAIRSSDFSGNWYDYQAEGGNKMLSNGASVGNAYPVSISAWKAIP